MKKEEQHPLLLLYMEDPDEDAPGAGYINKGRSQGLTNGAAAVITKWPGHVAPCWITGSILALAMILFGLMMLTITISPHVSTHRSVRSVICNIKRTSNLTNAEYLPNVHIVHMGSTWTERELETLELIARRYTNKVVNVMLLKNCNASTGDNNNQLETQTNIYNSDSDYETPNEENNVDSLSKKYKNINIMEQKCSVYFNHSILEHCWKVLDDPMILFAARVLAVWQSAGATFDLDNLLGNNTNDGGFYFSDEIVKSNDVDDNGIKREKRETEQNHTDSKTNETTSNAPDLNINSTNLKAESKPKKVKKIDLTNLINTKIKKIIKKELQKQLKENNISEVKNNKTANETNERNKTDESLVEVKIIDINAMENKNIHIRDITLRNVDKMLPEFELLPKDSVSVDPDGIYLLTNTPCHAFFEQLLKSIHITHGSDVREVMKHALKLFCNSGKSKEQICSGNSPL